MPKDQTSVLWKYLLYIKTSGDAYPYVPTGSKILFFPVSFLQYAKSIILI